MTVPLVNKFDTSSVDNIEQKPTKFLVIFLCLMHASGTEKQQQI